MSDETAFLSAIAASPEDTTARLVFADWLDEQDDFRGEFVRTAVAFERTPPYEFTRFQLGERLRDLLASPAFKTWLPAQPAFQWGWSRGFLSLIADTKLLQYEDPSEVAGWLSSNWIERVEFAGYTHGSMPEWEETFGLVHNTRELHLETDNYGSDVFTHLRVWPHLRSLGLSYLRHPWAELAALPHLRALELDNPDWTMMPELHNARLPDLEVLNLDKEWNDDLPHWGECFPKLRALTLTHYNVYPDEQCARFAECPQLRHLGLWQRYQPFTVVGLKALARLKQLRSLVLGPVPRGTIAGLAKLERLEHLTAYGEAKRVRGLGSLTQLRWLSLLNAGTLTRGLSSQVIALPQLARLDLRLDGFEDGAIAALAKAPALRVLTVSLPDELDPTAELVGLGQLRYLRIGSPTNLDLAALRKALPDCRIVHGAREPAEDASDWSWSG